MSDGLEASVGSLVKVFGKNAKVGGTPARLIAIDDKFATVITRRHRQEIRLPRHQVRVWKSGQAKWDRVNKRSRKGR